MAPTRHPKPQLQASEDRLLLESAELDLFETKKSVRVYVCPECQYELQRIVCLGHEARVCTHCRGVWLSYGQVRELARDVEWFQQLGPAIQLALREAT